MSLSSSIYPESQRSVLNAKAHRCIHFWALHIIIMANQWPIVTVATNGLDGEWGELQGEEDLQDRRPRTVDNFIVMSFSRPLHCTDRILICHTNRNCLYKVRWSTMIPVSDDNDNDDGHDTLLGWGGEKTGLGDVKSVSLVVNKMRRQSYVCVVVVSCHWMTSMNLDRDEGSGLDWYGLQDYKRRRRLTD